MYTKHESVSPTRHTFGGRTNQLQPFLRIVTKLPAECALPNRSTATDNRCRLLELPGELRNIIYEYTLTEQGGLITRGGHFYSVRMNSEKHDANQLKFVCKQLYAETKGLGVRFNVLTIKDTNQRFWFGNFKRFVSEKCLQNNLHRLREVILHDRIERFENERMYRRCSRGRGVTLLAILERQLNAICSRHFQACCHMLSTATITIRLEVCRAHPDFFLWAEIGSLVQYLFRGTISQICEYGMTWSREAQDLVQRFSRNHRSSPFPPNIRLTPASYEVAQFGLSDDFNGMHPDVRKEWLAQGELWYKSGF